MEKCSETIYPNEKWGSFHGHRCTRDMVIKRDGKPYCKIHDPIRKEAERRKKEKKWDEKYQKEREERRRLLAMYKACQDVPTKVLETIKVKDLIAMTNPIPGCEGDETK